MGRALRRWATHIQMWHSSQSIQWTSYFMVESWLNHLINWRLLTALQNDAQRRTVQLSLTGCWDLAESGWKWCENLCVDGGAKKSMKSITEYSVYLCISRWESSSQVYSSGSVMCESFLSSQMAANQVFQGAGCFARLVFFWDHAARKGCQGTFGSDKSHEVREPIPECCGTFCATCRSLPIAKEQTKNTGPAHAEIIFRRFDLKVYLTAVLFSICARRIHDTHWLNPSPMDPRQPHQTPSLTSLSQGKFNWLELRRFLAHLPAHLQILRPLAICLFLLNSCVCIYIFM